jgi:hypothetical protein
VLRIAYPDGLRTIVRTAPSTSAVVSWNTTEPAGRIDLAVYREDGGLSEWLEYAVFGNWGRRSLNGKDDVARIETDVVRADAPITAIEVRSSVPLEMIAVSTPVDPVTRPAIVPQAPLDVRPLSQYVDEHAHEISWCSPASLAMLLDYWEKPATVADVARAVYDETYAGTGNWAFNVAYAGTRGLRAAVVHLGGLDHAATFVQAGIPLALSFAWKNGELPGAPLGASPGHLAVLRGFPSERLVRVNDPAQPGVVTTYSSEKFDAVWRAHGGVAYAIVPPDRTAELLALANT